MKNEDWREGLWKLYESAGFDQINGDGKTRATFVMSDLEDFISSEIEKARKEGYAEGASNAVVTDIQEAIDKAREEGREESKREYAQAIATGQKVELTEELVDRIWSANLEEMYKMGLTKLLKSKEDGK